MFFIIVLTILSSPDKTRHQWLPVVQAAAEHYGLDWQLMDAMIAVESNWNNNAVSSAGAQGLAQIMPRTQQELLINNPFDPGQSIWGMALYLSRIQKLYGFRDWNLIIASYNAGPSRVFRCQCIPPYNETRNYVRKVFDRWTDRQEID